MKNVACLVVKTVGIIVAAVLLGFLLLCLAYLVPISQEVADTTSETINREGWYPEMPVLSNSYNEYFASYLPGVLDGVTVRVMFQSAFSTTDNGIVYAAASYYPYYWHGYTAILRPLIHFISYENIQVLNYVLQIIIVVCLCVGLAWKKGLRYAIAMASSYCLLMPMALFICPQYWTVFYPAYIGMLILIKHYDFYKYKSRLFFFFLIMGCITSYLDLLTFPLLTWGLPMLIFIVLDDEAKDKIYYIKRVVNSGVAWILGYGFMWFGKWVISTIVLKQNIILDAVDEIFLRTGGYLERVSYNRFTAIYNCWKHYNYVIYAWIIVGWFAWWIINGFLKGWIRDNKNWSIGLIGISTFAWYLVVYEHALTHHLFEYRTFSVCITAAMFLIISSVPNGKIALKNISLKKGLPLVATMFVGVLVALIMVITSREKLRAYNSYAPFDEYEFTGESIEFTVTPNYDRIADLGYGLRSENGEGYYVFTVYDGEEIVDSLEIPITVFEGGNFKEFGVDWRLQAGKSYNVRVTLKDTTAPVYYYISRDGANNIKEVTNMLVDGKPVNGEPLISFEYWARSDNRNFKIFLGISWIIAVTLVAYLFIPALSKERIN